MRTSRFSLVLGLGLFLSASAGNFVAAAQAPKISRPRPAPPGPPNVLPLPPAVIDSTLAIEGDEIEARRASTRLNVDVLVNGRGPYRFLVDSGADTSVVGLRIAHDLQLPLGTPAILNGMTSRNLVDRVRVAQLTLGPSTIRDLHVPALREVDLGGDGMIGIDALTQQRLMLDFEKRLIKVEDARVRMKILPGDIVVTARRQRGQLILAQVTAAGFPLDAVIDTGTEISIGNLALRDKLLRKRTKFETIETIGVTGVKVDLQVATIRELRLGSVTLENVPIAFADVPPFEVFGLSKEPALLLGTDILSTFRRVSLDFRARKVRFQLRNCKPAYLVMSTSSRAATTRLFSKGTSDVCGR